MDQEDCPLDYQSPVKLILITIATCGVYYFVMLYKWIKVINSQSKFLIDPALGVVLSIFTCGIASIYFEYEIAKRSASVIRTNSSNYALVKKNLTPPNSSLKEIILYGNIGTYITCFISSGVLSFITLVFSLWIMAALQNSLQYMLMIEDPNF